MKRTITLAMLLLGTVAFAQQKEIKKLEKLYSKNKIEKGLEYSKSLKKSSPDEAGYSYFLGLFYNKKSELAKTKSFKKKYSNQFIVNIESGLKLDSGRFLTSSNHYDFIHNQYKNYALNLAKKNATNTKHAHQVLATFFEDTTHFYRSRLVQEFDKNIEPNESLVYARDCVAVNLDSLIAFAESLVGTPYKYGGESKKGLDCSGFNLFVYKNSGIKLPHNAQLQSKLGKKVPIEKSKKGDLIFFGSKTKKGYHASHAGMVYQNDDKGFGVIHCVSKGVSIDTKLWESYWSKRVLFVKRVVE